MIIDFLFGKSLNARRVLHLPCALLLVFLAEAITSADAALIPTSRMTTWTGNVGIPGGIPNRQTIFTNMINLDTNGFSDVSSKVQAAISLCPSNEVVYLPAGTYLLTNRLMMANYMTLRGAGMGKTVFVSGITNALHVINFNSGGGVYSNNTVYLKNASAYAGATNITLSTNFFSGTGSGPITPGMMVVVTLLNNTNFLNSPGDLLGSNQVTTISGQTGTPNNYVDPTWGGTRCAGQTELVIATNGNTITVGSPLFIDYTNLSLMPAVTPITKKPLVWAGVESLTVRQNNLNDLDNFNFQDAAYCWLQNVECDHTDYNPVEWDWCYRCEMDDSYCHEAYYYLSGTDHALLLGYKTSGCLLQDNIFFRSHAAVILNWGASGNVVAYNFLSGMMDQGATNWFAPCIYTHGAHPMFNLIEGNVLSGIKFDSIHGSASDNTIFRNWSLDQQTAYAPTNGGAIIWSSAWQECQGNHPIDMEFEDPANNVVGNVLGSSWGTTNGGVWMTDAPTNRIYNYWQGQRCVPQPYALSIGYTYSGDNGSCTNDNAQQPLISEMITGNYDVYANMTVWDNKGNQSLPKSLYLTNQPAWWTNYGNSSPWPPIGPDVAGITNAIPAQLRFKAIVAPTIIPPSLLKAQGGAGD